MPPDIWNSAIALVRQQTAANDDAGDYIGLPRSNKRRPLQDVRRTTAGRDTASTAQVRFSPCAPPRNTGPDSALLLEHELAMVKHSPAIERSVLICVFVQQQDAALRIVLKATGRLAIPRGALPRLVRFGQRVP